MSEQTSMVAPPAAGADVVAAGELATGLALATTGALDAAGWLVTDALGDAVGVASSAAVAVAGSTVAVVGAALDFVVGLHAAEDNATTTMAAAADSDRTCMAAPWSTLRRRALPPFRR
jgi:hypothetical protein